MTPLQKPLRQKQLANYFIMKHFCTTWYELRERQLRNLLTITWCCTIQSYVFLLSSPDVICLLEKKLHIIKLHLQGECSSPKADWICATCNFLPTKKCWTWEQIQFLLQRSVLSPFQAYAVMPFPVYWELLPPNHAAFRAEFSLLFDKKKGFSERKTSRVSAYIRE